MAGQLKEELVLKTGQFSQGINSAISEVQKLKKKGSELGSGFDKSLGGIVSNLKAFNVAAIAGLAAGKALGEAMKRNATINEYYEKSIATCKSGLETFYNALSRGDFNNFISNFEKATASARNAYTALKELENTKIFSQLKLKQLENAYSTALKLSKDRNLSEKERIKHLENARKIMMQQVKIINIQLKQQQSLARSKYLQAVGEVGIEGVKDSTLQKLALQPKEKRDAYINDYYNKLEKAKNNPSYQTTWFDKTGKPFKGFDLERFKKVNQVQWRIVNALEKMDGLAENPAYQDYLEIASGVLDLEKQIEDLDQEIKASDRKVNADLLKDYEKEEKVLEIIQHQFEDLVNKANLFSNELQKIQKDTKPTDTSRLDNISLYDKMNAQRYQDLVNQGKGKFSYDKNGGDKTFNEQGFEVYFTANEESVQDIYQKYDNLVNRVQEAMRDNDLGILSAEEVNATIDYINKELEKLGLKPIELHVETDAEKKLKQTTSMITQMGSAIQGLGQALEMPALDVAGVMAQAIAAIIEGYAFATSDAGKKLGAFGWLGFGAIGLAQLVNIISTVKSLGAFANGGIVGGSSYSGDRLYARVNSGEMILNSNQQQHLFNMINNGGGGVASTGEVQFVIKGSDLYGTLRNYNSKMKKVR